MTNITGTFCKLSVSTRSGKQVKTLQHHTYDMYKGWIARAPAPHPLAKVEVYQSPYTGNNKSRQSGTEASF